MRSVVLANPLSQTHGDRVHDEGLPRRVHGDFNVGPDNPARSLVKLEARAALAGALCAPPFCGNGTESSGAA
jgi:hypothetical protein